MISLQINEFMSGFLLPDDTERLPANFIEHLPGRTDPRMLYKSEWRIVMDLAKKVIEVYLGEEGDILEGQDVD